MRRPKYWSFSFNISPSSEHPGLISFRMVGSPCSARDSQQSSPTPQFKSINSSALSFLHSRYMTTGKTIASTRWTFVGKVISLLFNMLSRLVIREGDGAPLQYSCLENPMDGGAWWAAVHGVAKSWTRLGDFTFTFHFHALGKEMAPTSVFLPGESQGRGNLVGCRL